MTNAKQYNQLFDNVIEKYHIKDNVDQDFENPFPSDNLEHLLYRKCWIDTVQWHYEDIIRDPEIDPVSALSLKRQIDASNQDRTDMVEYVDSYFLEKYTTIALDCLRSHAKLAQAFRQFCSETMGFGDIDWLF